MSQTSRPFSLLPILVLVALACTAIAAAPPPTSRLITFPNPGPDVLADMAGHGWDIWEVTPDRVIALLTPDQVATLQMQQIEVNVLDNAPQYMVNFPACFRTFDAAVTQMRDWAERYPDLVELIDAGPSWQTAQGQADRRLWTLRITNKADVEPKPQWLLVALHHAREIVTPEVALNLAELLLTSYGHDADITWLVDNRDIWIVPFVNPDGHLYAEYSVDWRKNANNTQSTCATSSPPNSFGVDLNRNYDHEWATVGASSNPCNLTYRGRAAFSEPETQAIRDLVQNQKFNLIISLHSFSDLIMYPWGYTYAPAPDDTGLRNIASVLATFNGYTPEQSSDLYPTSGDTCDWAYGAQGIPCFTVEIGSGAVDNYFWPDCTTAHEQWLENRDALLHAIKLAGDPYRLAEAPLVRGLQVRQRGRFITVQAVFDRQATSPEPPAGGEVFIDQIGSPGTGILLTPDDQILDTPVESMSATVDLSGVQGQHVVYVAGIDESGRHGPPTAAYFEPCPDVTGDAVINVTDVMQLAARWPTQAGDLDYDAALDLNGDGLIDVQDVAQMSAFWGLVCAGSMP